MSEKTNRLRAMLARMSKKSEDNDESLSEKMADAGESLGEKLSEGKDAVVGAVSSVTSKNESDEDKDEPAEGTTAEDLSLIHI